MRHSLLLAPLLVGAALAFSATPARAQVTINIGTPPPPPVVVVREVHPVKVKYKKHHRHYYQPRPVMLVPAQPVYYVPAGHPGRGHGRGHGHGRH
ncbi:hypothetical protein LJ737_03170 [Hymenobacter sp. 15J16-1T3B]|uniref:hypothetical protein n=1 Tax=Hymenobacter sp. 15J16-1T3B TaxID=2886941 RepID=UPI001D10F920|nr:hypothetical protein [Hymenobacter sp. 15J16-1T3B]MCC3156219.1 hypothetical protein [Hymenobacter sp. 15J16-1T3B]